MVQNTDRPEAGGAPPADYCAINNNDATKPSGAPAQRAAGSLRVYLKLVLSAAAAT